MQIDKQTIKALAADTRIEILKSLKYRRKTPSELSKELELAPSTVLEHLNKLEDAGLIKREETGHKWIYFNLTDKGENLIRPKYPVQFIVILSLGLLFVFAGIYRYATPQFEAAERAMVPAIEIGGKAAEIVEAPTIDWLMIGLFVVGIILIVISLVIRLKKK